MVVSTQAAAQTVTKRVLSKVESELWPPLNGLLGASVGPNPIATPPHDVSIARCALNSGSIGLNELWRWLLAGDVTATATFGVANRSFAILECGCLPGTRPLASSSSEILERVLEGECPKVLASEMKMAVSSLSLRCASVLTAIGLAPWVSRAPALVLMSAHAARGTVLGRAQVDVFRCDGPRRWLVSAPNPADALRRFLTNAECDVARLAIDGKTHTEIGAIRKTSQRTVANQLASTFRKLGVSGRASLRAKAVLEYARAGNPAANEASEHLATGPADPVYSCIRVDAAAWSASPPLPPLAARFL